MNKFTGRGPGRTGQSFAGKSSFKDQNHQVSSERKMTRESEYKTEKFSTTCSECNKKCDVPFKPSNDKPVYCSACFGMKKSGNELRGASKPAGRTERRPYGTAATTPKSDNQGILELKRQISELEVKLNKILDLLNPPQPSPKKKQD
jgi:CxxC-x17-CxxC domain-containing protein